MGERPKYHTTEIGAERSASEIVELVKKYGGRPVAMEWTPDGELGGIRFSVSDAALGEVDVRLVPRVEEMTARLRRAAPYTARTKASVAQWEKNTQAQARRMAWRQLRDFTEQVLYAVETGLLRMGEAFMWALVTTDAAGEETTVGDVVYRIAQTGGGAGPLRLGPGRGEG